MTQAERKRRIRALMRGKRSQVSLSEAETLSLLAQRRLLSLPEWGRARRVGLYSPTQNELSTSLLLQEALRGGKEAFFPKVLSKGAGLMRYLRVFGPDDFEPGAFGIFEPKEGLPAEDFASAPLDLVVLPGVAFDRSCLRLGFGGGYYDRDMARRKGAFLVGLCYSFQLVDALPSDPWDVGLDCVCTEGESVRSPSIRL